MVTFAAASRIDYRSVYTIRHDVKVRSFGKVKEDSMHAFKLQFKEVWSSELSESKSRASGVSKRQPVLGAGSSQDN